MGSQSQGPRNYNQHWQYRSTINAEELFRKIFGDQVFGGFNDFEDYSETKYGFGAAQEVCKPLLPLLTINFPINVQHQN